MAEKFIMLGPPSSDKEIDMGDEDVEVTMELDSDGGAAHGIIDPQLDLDDMYMGADVERHPKQRATVTWNEQEGLF